MYNVMSALNGLLKLFKSNHVSVNKLSNTCILRTSMAKYEILSVHYLTWKLYFSVKSSMIDRTLCESAVEECNQEQDDDR